MSAARAGKAHSADKAYWDKVAGAFDDEIFDVCGSDLNGVVRSRILAAAGRGKTVIDLGCGIGRSLPMLSRLFGKVCAVDISERCLARARQLNLPNVEYICADISRPGCRLPQCDVVVCINAILMPGVDRCRNAFDAVRRAVKKGGAVVLAVPALESVLYTRSKIIAACARKKQPFRQKLDDYCRLGRGPGCYESVVAVHGVPTKHYLREELVSLLTERKLTITGIEKIEYDWNSEITNLPWPNQPPYPWDWCVAAGRR